MALIDDLYQMMTDLAQEIRECRDKHHQLMAQASSIETTIAKRESIFRFITLKWREATVGKNNPAKYIAKKDLVHGAEYGGECRNASISEWDAHSQVFKYRSFKMGIAYINEIPHIEDTPEGEDGFMPWGMIE